MTSNKVEALTLSFLGAGARIFYDSDITPAGWSLILRAVSLGAWDESCFND